MFILNKQRMSETLLRQNEQWKQLRLIHFSTTTAGFSGPNFASNTHER